MEYHRPVLLAESVEWLNVKPGGCYVDLTFGGGGHSRKILEMLGQNGRLIAFDRDEDAWAGAPDNPGFTLVPVNYRHMERFLEYLNAVPVDGVLADLGVSSHQLDEGERGFSFRVDAPLDMRMGRRSGKSAATVLNEYSAEDLARVLGAYGEVRRPMAIAHAIVKKRTGHALATTGQLTDLLKPFSGKAEWKFYAQVFQAIRIEVNDELRAVEEVLEQTARVIKPGGRLVVISYHSLEDRLVKRFMRTGNLQGELEKDAYGVPQTPWKLLVKKPIEPGKKEIEENSRARSARMRVAEKI